MNKPTIAIFGLGVTGLSFAKFLLARGTSFIAYDSREAPPQLAEFKQLAPNARCLLATITLDDLAGIDTILLSPGLPQTLPILVAAKHQGIEIISDIELFARHCCGRVIAITGTNGKSTVTKLVYDMAIAAGRSAAIGGNYGIPALDLLTTNAELFILEVSSYQLETVHSLKHHIACYLNCTPDHLERYGTMEAYSAAKQRIYLNSACQIFNLDDPYTLPLPDRTTTTFSIGVDGNDADFGLDRNAQGQTFITAAGKPLIAINELTISGTHNALNAAAALAIGECAGLPVDSMLTTLRQFEGLPYRCQLVLHADNVAWYNDSKSTNVASTKAALSGLTTTKSVILILGGQTKQGDNFAELLPLLERCVKTVIIFGVDQQLIATQLAEFNELVILQTLTEVITHAKSVASPGDSILFSPAGASFDLFTSYLDRGEQFTTIATQLADLVPHE